MSTTVDEWPRSIERANQTNTAYRTKYRCYGDRFISLMISPEARAATIKALLASEVRIYDSMDKR